MEIDGLHLAHVTRRSKSSNSPRLAFCAGWMADIGFIPNALVQYLPELGVINGGAA